MFESQRERDWETVSSIMALIANVNNTKRGKSYTPSQFNPTIENKKIKPKVLPYSKENLNKAKTFFESLKGK